MQHSPLPWTQDSRGDSESPYEVMLDAKGKVVFDTINSDVALIETEYDETGGVALDAQGRADFEFVLRAIKSAEVVVAIIAMLDREAERARGMVKKYRMDDPEFREWSARAAGLEDAADSAREVAAGRSRPEPPRSAS